MRAVTHCSLPRFASMVSVTSETLPESIKVFVLSSESSRSCGRGYVVLWQELGSHVSRGML